MMQSEENSITIHINEPDRLVLMRQKESGESGSQGAEEVRILIIPYVTPDWILRR